MKISIRSLVFAGALFLLLPATVLAQGNEQAAVDRVMQKMMRGFELGDANLIFELLRKDAVVIGYSPSRGSLVSQSGEEWAEGFNGVATDEDQRHRSYEILDVTENSASVKVMLDYPGWKGVDYLAFSKINGNWMIVSKSWSGQVKPKAP